MQKCSNFHVDFYLGLTEKIARQKLLGIPIYTMNQVIRSSGGVCGGHVVEYLTPEVQKMGGSALRQEHSKHLEDQENSFCAQSIIA